MLSTLIDLVLHLDAHLAATAAWMGPWLYLLLFFIIFAETGLVVTPFLPGDSLLFAVGALTALPASELNPVLMGALLILAAILGDNTNYFIGRWIGIKVFSQPKSLFFNPSNLRKTQSFYDRHGGKTVFLARFLPIFRTFAPFVAGIGRMERRQFLFFSVSGSVVWISLFVTMGYLFGNIPWVKRNFASLIMAVIVISLIPLFLGAFSQYIKNRRGITES
ncbi:MAG: DedA family protein [Bdellovibrionaceae bacterium]|nr:DedA family protein [Pseudobdellovibrionaceae bacterium]MBX3034304.1 DedA family protein [Pseudobdellovibrionaceae bacterium]